MPSMIFLIAMGIISSILASAFIKAFSIDIKVAEFLRKLFGLPLA